MDTQATSQQAVPYGLPSEGAVAHVRAGYSAHAVETRAQAAFVARFSRA